MAERNIKVNDNVVAMEVQLAVSARAMGLDTEILENDLTGKGVRLYPLLGAARTLSPEDARKRIEVVLNFAQLTKTPINPEYIYVLNRIHERR